MKEELCLLCRRCSQVVQCSQSSSHSYNGGKLLRDKSVRLFEIVAVAVTCTHDDDRNLNLSR